MKRRILTLVLALILCLSLIPGAAVAAGVSATEGGVTVSLTKNAFDQKEPIVVTVSGVTAEMEAARCLVGIYAPGEGSQYRSKDYQHCAAGTADYTLSRFNVDDGPYEIRFYDSYNAPSFSITIPVTIGPVAVQGTLSLDKAAYKAGETITVSVTGVTEQMIAADAFVGMFRKGAAHENGAVVDKYIPLSAAGDGTFTLKAPNENGDFEMRFYTDMWHLSAENMAASAPFAVSGAMQASPWAAEELQQAEELGLIPEALVGADLTKPITRAEFAAVAVKVYENLAGKAAAVGADPFTDTDDPEVLKAYNVGITTGTGDGTTFSPAMLLNREQAATMLTRVYTVVTGAEIVTSTTPTDFRSVYLDVAASTGGALSYAAPTPFADDGDISGWARDSVYFMAVNAIIQGSGGKFMPKAVTTAQEAAGYAQATREQALLIAVRMVQNLGA